MTEALKAALFAVAGLAITITADFFATPAGRVITVGGFAWTCGMIGVAVTLYMESRKKTPV